MPQPLDVVVAPPSRSTGSQVLRLAPSAISKLQRIAQTQDRMLARVYQRPALGGASPTLES